MKNKPFYETNLNPITMWPDSKLMESIRFSNLKGEERKRIKKSLKNYKL